MKHNRYRILVLLVLTYIAALMLSSCSNAKPEYIYEFNSSLDIRCLYIRDTGMDDWGEKIELLPEKKQNPLDNNNYRAFSCNNLKDGELHTVDIKMIDRYYTEYYVYDVNIKLGYIISFDEESYGWDATVYEKEYYITISDPEDKSATVIRSMDFNIAG